MRSEYEIARNYQEIEIKYIKMLAKQIRDIGKMTPASINRVKILLRAGMNIRELNKELRKATNLSQKQINKVYMASGISIFEIMKARFSVTKAFTYKNLIEEIARNTAKDIINISQSTSIQRQYLKAIDKAVQEISLGIGRPEQIVRDILRDESNKGLRVVYKSGVTRRLDSAVRMNVAQGLTELHNELQEKVGADFGADGIEVSAHAMCAPDHLDVQGRQFTKEKFKAVNEALHRQIGHLNCYHYTIAIKMGDKPAYTEEQLEELKESSLKEYDIDGHKYIRFEAGQLLRRIETRMRYKKEQYIAYREIGDTDKMRMCKNDLKKMKAKYMKVCNITGLEPELERAYVPDFVRR